MTHVSKKYPKGLMWFRRDLRTQDNAALHQALRDCQQVWCVFVFDTDILEPLRERGLTADRRIEFIRESLLDLDEQLRALGRAHGHDGVGLIVRHGRATEAVPRLASELGVQAVFANHDDEPRSRERDAQVLGALAHRGVLLHTRKDHVIFERHEVLTQNDRPFTVFTPYKNAWLRQLTPYHLKAYPVERHAGALASCPASAPPGIPELASISRLLFDPR